MARTISPPPGAAGFPTTEAGAFYTNVVRDWCDVQQPERLDQPYRPADQTGIMAGPCGAARRSTLAGSSIRTTADKRILAESYPSDKAWLDFLAANVADGILQPYNTNYNGGGNFLGDWAEPYTKADPLKGKEFGSTPEALLFNNCVYAMDLRTFIAIAKVLEKPDDAAAYGKRLENLKTKVQARFFNAEQNTLLGHAARSTWLSPCSPGLRRTTRGPRSSPIFSRRFSKRGLISTWAAPACRCS